MELDKDVEKDWIKLTKMAKELMPNEVVSQEINRKDKNGKVISYKYRSKEKIGSFNHEYFLYITRLKKSVKILFDTGKDPEYPIELIDIMNITKHCTNWGKTIPTKMYVKPGEINNIYTESYINDLMMRIFQQKKMVTF